MADDWWKYAAEGAKFLNSNNTADKSDAAMQAAYDQMMANLRERFGDYDALGSAGYKDVAAQQLGPSSFDSIQQDPRARQDQQESIAALEDLAANGGLSLADMAALNEVQRNLNRNDTARRQGLANEFAARGQLGSGAQLAMSLANQQNAADSANQRGESVAAQAQARALQAILQKGQMSRAMTNDDYARARDAALARDAIEARNAAARTDASKYNNSLRGQAFEDQLAKARGKTALTHDLNQVVFGKGGQTARTTAAKGDYLNKGIDAVSRFGSGSTSSNSSGGSGGTTIDDGGDSDTDIDDESVNYNDDD